MAGKATHKMNENYNPDNGLATMPVEYLGRFWNACTDPCDMLEGPCACGAWHHQEEWPDYIQEEVFGNISSKPTIQEKLAEVLEEHLMEEHRQHLIDDISTLYPPDSHPKGRELLMAALCQEWRHLPIEVLNTLRCLCGQREQGESYEA